MTTSTGMMGPTGKTGNIRPSGYNVGQLQNFTPEMMEFFQHIMSQLGPDSFLAKLGLGDEEAFNEMEAPALRQFNQLQGGIASKFSGMGSFGNRRSSGFQNTASQQASNFAQDLASQRTALRMKAIQELVGLGNDVLQQRPYEQYIVPKREKSNPWVDLAAKAAGAIPGAIAGGATGGWAGAAKGFGSAF
jgi:hypothetical protein